MISSYVGENDEFSQMLNGELEVDLIRRFFSRKM